MRCPGHWFRTRREITISLMSHALKVFVKIIHHRVHKKLEQGKGDTQFGVRNALRATEALNVLNVFLGLQQSL